MKKEKESTVIKEQMLRFSFLPVFLSRNVIFQMQENKLNTVNSRESVLHASRHAYSVYINSQSGEWISLRIYTAFAYISK